MPEAYPLKLNLPLTHPVQLYVHERGDMHVSKTVKETGQWEIFETQLIAACLKGAANFVDVGANIGYYSMVAAALDPNLSIWAFEPEPRNASLFLKNRDLNAATHVHFQQAGLAASDRQIELYLSDDNFGDHQIYDRGEARSSVTVDLLNGSDFLSTKINTIDVLKIDTQGAEFEVISGLMPLLKVSTSVQIVIEFWPFGLRKSGAHGHQLLDLLLSLKLPLHIIDHIEHQLIPCTEADLRGWIDSLDKHSENEGFMNIFIGQVPVGMTISSTKMVLV